MATAKKKPASLRPQKAAQKPAAKTQQSKNPAKQTRAGSKTTKKVLARATACAGSHQPAKSTKREVLDFKPTKRDNSCATKATTSGSKKPAGKKINGSGRPQAAS